MIEAAFAPRRPRRAAGVAPPSTDDRARRGGVSAAAVVVFPSQPQLDPRAPDTLQQRLITLGRDAGWTVIDLLPAFRRATAAPRAPFFLDRWHPSGAGHRIAAAATARALACRGLVPVPAPDGCDQPAPGAPTP
jgi:hypothetical protein